MATLVGLQNKFEDTLKELIELDYDAVEAYDAAIKRLECEEYKKNLRSFREDHQRHISELSALLQKKQITPPTEPSAKQWLAKGKVVLANLIGDNTILLAMKTNEDDTNKAYENILNHNGRWEESVEILDKGLADEQRHRSWIEQQLEKQK